MSTEIEIRERQVGDVAEAEAIARLVRRAFGEEQGVEIAQLVADIESDETGYPLLHLVAEKDGQIIGHVLFSRAAVGGNAEPVCRILAPLAIDPDFQKRGVGTRIVQDGLSRLRKEGVALVFVLGDPGYYNRLGFITADDFGLEVTHPMSEEYRDAWMVQELSQGVLGTVSGQVGCGDKLADPKHWGA